MFSVLYGKIIKGMKILVVSQYFWPENFRINDLCSELQKRGHKLTVLTGIPNYPEGKTFQSFLDRPNEIKHALCSSDKARKILNYKTTVTLDESIDKVINFIKKNGTKKFEYNYELEIKNEKTPKTWIDQIF